MAVETIRNLNLIHVRWGRKPYRPATGETISSWLTNEVPICFNCSSKGIPALQDAATWNVSTDNPSEYSGRTVSGKSPGLETIELVIETDPMLVYRELLPYMGTGIQSDLEFCYLPRRYYTSRYQDTIANGGFNLNANGALYPSSMWPAGYTQEAYDGREYTIVVPRVTLSGLKPAGGENNSASQTTVSFTAEGGPVENMIFMVYSHYFTNETDVAATPGLMYGSPTSAWDGIEKTGKPTGAAPTAIPQTVTAQDDNTTDPVEP